MDIKLELLEYQETAIKSVINVFDTTKNGMIKHAMSDKFNTF